MTALQAPGATYSAAIGDQVLCDSTGAAVTVNLPAITAANKGMMISVKAVPPSDASGVNTAPHGTDTVDGLAAGAGPGIAAPYSSVVLVSDGVSNWNIESGW